MLNLSIWWLIEIKLRKSRTVILIIRGQNKRNNHIWKVTRNKKGRFHPNILLNKNIVRNCFQLRKFKNPKEPDYHLTVAYRKCMWTFGCKVNDGFFWEAEQVSGISGSEKILRKIWKIFFLGFIVALTLLIHHFWAGQVPEHSLLSEIWASSLY